MLDKIHKLQTLASCYDMARNELSIQLI